MDAVVYIFSNICTIGRHIRVLVLAFNISNIHGLNRVTALCPLYPLNVCFVYLSVCPFGTYVRMCVRTHVRIYVCMYMYVCMNEFVYFRPVIVPCVCHQCLIVMSNYSSP